VLSDSGIRFSQGTKENLLPCAAITPLGRIPKTYNGDVSQVASGKRDGMEPLDDLPSGGHGWEPRPSFGEEFDRKHRFTWRVRQARQLVRQQPSQASIVDFACVRPIPLNDLGSQLAQTRASEYMKFP
jgi:hypothetical protein